MRYFVYRERGELCDSLETDCLDTAMDLFHSWLKDGQDYYYATVWDNVNGLEDCKVAANSQGSLE